MKNLLAYPRRTNEILARQQAVLEALSAHLELMTDSMTSMHVKVDLLNSRIELLEQSPLGSLADPTSLFSELHVMIDSAVVRLDGFVNFHAEEIKVRLEELITAADRDDHVELTVIGAAEPAPEQPLLHVAADE
jgi:hypothetical protein